MRLRPGTRHRRPPAVAGLFYPAEPERLAASLQQCLDALPRRDVPATTAAPGARLRALVVPHAGYVYSGPTAGVAYRRLLGLPADARPRTVLLLGPPHRVPVAGIAVSSAQAWTTPLGDVPLDVDGRDRLLAAAPDHVLADDHAHASEHSLEVQLPFLQSVLPGVPVLPLLVGDLAPGAGARVLRPWWHDPTVLVVVSTDLSHYEPAASAERHDARTAAAVCAADPSSVGDRDACGARPLRVLLTLAAADGARVRLLDRRTSADTAGSPERVVGYGAFAVEVSP
jgi:AmmeMemoRadiSam system protein B